MEDRPPALPATEHTRLPRTRWCGWAEPQRLHTAATSETRHSGCFVPLAQAHRQAGLVMGGVDLYAVGQLLGHRTPRMTQRYAHLSPSYMAGAIGKLDSVFGDVMPDYDPDSAP